MPLTFTFHEFKRADGVIKWLTLWPLVLGSIPGLCDSVLSLKVSKVILISHLQSPMLDSGVQRMGLVGTWEISVFSCFR